MRLGRRWWLLPGSRSGTPGYVRLFVPEPRSRGRETKLDQLREGFESTLAAERRFAAFACHELRGPLARQHTIMEVAIQDPHPTVHSLREALEMAVVAGEEQGRLIDALRMLTAAGHGLREPRPFELDEVVALVVSDQAAAAAHRGVTVRCLCAPAPAFGSRDLAGRLATNLIDNAIRYNEHDGVVDVVVEKRDGHAYLCVSNSGPLVDPQDVDRLFQPFQRAADTRYLDGSGLGLAIVEAITSAHEGRIRARARPQGGLQVEVRLPSPCRTRSRSVARSP
jgi:signal transduction histidine kinase